MSVDGAVTVVERGAAARVVVVGGGLAGLAAAAALAEAGIATVVLESRRQVGGRAASFEDPVSGGLVDACQPMANGPPALPPGSCRPRCTWPRSCSG